MNQEYGEEIALGRRIDVAAKPDDSMGYQFDYWSAPDNLLDGERSERARFMLMPPSAGAKSGEDSVIVAPRFYRGHIELPAENSPATCRGISYSFSAGGDAVELDPLPYGHTHIAGPRGSYVNASYTYDPTYDECLDEDHGHDPNEPYRLTPYGWNCPYARTLSTSIQLAIIGDRRGVVEAGADIECDDDYGDQAPFNHELVFSVASQQGATATWGTMLLGSMDLSYNLPDGQNPHTYYNPTVKVQIYPHDALHEVNTASSMSSFQGADSVTLDSIDESTGAVSIWVTASESIDGEAVVDEKEHYKLTLDIDADADLSDVPIEGFFRLRQQRRIIYMNWE